MSGSPSPAPERRRRESVDDRPLALFEHRRQDDLYQRERCQHISLIDRAQLLRRYFEGDRTYKLCPIPGTPDPNSVIYMYGSLWGGQQTVMLLIYIIVLLRYRNLIPLMFLLMLVEIGFRWVSASIHPLSEDFYVRTPPGKGDRTYKLPSRTTSEYGRYVKSLGVPP